MPRIPYPDTKELSENKEAAIAQSSFNVVRMMTRASDGVFEGLSAFLGSFYAPGVLDPVLREIAILRVGYISRSRYETFQHEAAAHQQGMTEAQIEALKKGGKHPDVFNASQQAVLDFTEEVVMKVKPSDATLADIRKHLNDTEVVNLVLLIGGYMTVSRFLETTGVEIDDQAIDWKEMDASR